MLREWTSYRLTDFLLFSERVYRRLFEAHNDTWWPLPVIAAVAALAGLVVVLRNDSESVVRRGLWAALGAIWAFVAIAFLRARYAAISPIAALAVWAFVAQGMALALLALLRLAPVADLRRWLGTVFVLWGVVFYPAWAWWRDGSLAAAEWFGMAPDPTAIGTIGFVLVGVGSRTAVALLLVIPIAWCAVSALTLRAMDERQMMGKTVGEPIPVATSTNTGSSEIGQQERALRELRTSPLLSSRYAVRITAPIL